MHESVSSIVEECGPYINQLLRPSRNMVDGFSFKWLIKQFDRAQSHKYYTNQISRIGDQMGDNEVLNKQR